MNIYKKQMVYTTGMLIMLGIFILEAGITNGRAITQYIFLNVHANFSDFFDMLKISRNTDIYDQGILYPALAMTIFRIMSIFVPNYVLKYESVDMQGNLYTVMLFISYVIISLVILLELIFRKIGRNTNCKIAIAYITIFS